MFYFHVFSSLQAQSFPPFTFFPLCMLFCACLGFFLKLLNWLFKRVPLQESSAIQLKSRRKTSNLTLAKVIKPRWVQEAFNAHLKAAFLGLRFLRQRALEASQEPLTPPSQTAVGQARTQIRLPHPFRILLQGSWQNNWVQGTGQSGITWSFLSLLRASWTPSHFS